MIPNFPMDSMISGEYFNIYYKVISYILAHGRICKELTLTTNGMIHNSFYLKKYVDIVL